MRIVGGKYRGRALISPKGTNTRPTSDRARESIFNIISHAKWLSSQSLQDAHILDIFAGTGALGIEALSQGAAHATFIETAPTAITALRQNITQLGANGDTHILKLDATKPPRRPKNSPACSFLFLDPPYGKDLGVRALRAFAKQGWLASGAVCVIEMAKKEPEEIPSEFEIQDTRTYGVAQVVFMIWRG